MDATRKTPDPAPDPEAVDALALVRRIRDDFVARTAGLGPEELAALIQREAAVLGGGAAAPAPRRNAA